MAERYAIYSFFSAIMAYPSAIYSMPTYMFVLIICNTYTYQMAICFAIWYINCSYSTELIDLQVNSSRKGATYDTRKQHPKKRQGRA
jgi:hypothetical protein